jgi:hypothetical protein
VDRLKFLLGAVVAAVVGVVLLLGLTTVHSLCRGSRAGWFGRPERVAVAEVRSCRRLGPLSIDGLGYWWKCAVLLIVEWSVFVLTVFMVVMYLLRAVLGRQGYAALYDRYQRLQRPQRTST